MIQPQSLKRQGVSEGVFAARGYNWGVRIYVTHTPQKSILGRDGLGICKVWLACFIEIIKRLFLVKHF